MNQQKHPDIAKKCRLVEFDNGMSPSFSSFYYQTFFFSYLFFIGAFN